MPDFFDQFERNIPTMDILDLGHKLTEGLQEEPRPTLYLLRNQTAQDTRNILLAGSPSTFNPEYIARLYRRLVTGLISQTTDEHTQKMLENRRDNKLKVHVVDRETSILEDCKRSMKERSEFLKEKAGITFKYDQLDLSTNPDNLIPPGSIDVTFMDCLLSLNPGSWIEILKNIARLSGPYGIIFFREMLAQSPWLPRNTPEGINMYCPELEANYQCLYKKRFEEGAKKAGLSVEYLPTSKPHTFRHHDPKTGFFGVKIREQVGLLIKD